MSKSESSIKRCPRCGESYPATNKYFYSHAKHGLQGYCKACRATPARREINLAKMRAPDGFKVCNGCVKAFPPTLEFFPADSRRRSGLNGRCRACLTRDKANSAERNGRRSGRRRALWELRDRLAMKGVRECTNCGLRLPATSDHFYKDKSSPDGFSSACSGCISERSRQWAVDNPEKLIARNHNRRALLDGAPGQHFAADIKRMFKDQGGLCAYCEIPLSSGYHIDHMVPLSRGGTNGCDNLAITCASCNLRKYTRTTEEFMATLT